MEDYSKMDMANGPEYVAIFSEEDVRNNFISSIALAMDKCANIISSTNRYNVAIFAQGINGNSMNHIAKIIKKPVLHLQVYKDIAEQYGVDAEIAENLFNVASIIRSCTGLSLTESVYTVEAITENYNISRV